MDLPALFPNRQLPNSIDILQPDFYRLLPPFLKNPPTVGRISQHTGAPFSQHYLVLLEYLNHEVFEYFEGPVHLFSVAHRAVLIRRYS